MTTVTTDILMVLVATAAYSRLEAVNQLCTPYACYLPGAAVQDTWKLWLTVCRGGSRILVKGGYVVGMHMWNCTNIRDS